MPATRANWHVPAIVVAAEDPFGDIPVEQTGVAVHLDDVGELELALVELIEQEGQLFNQGVTCAIKDRANTSCHACPLNDKGDLCRVGRDTEKVCTQLAVARG